MVFYTELKEYEDIEPTLEGAPPSLGEYVGAVSQDMWNSNPTTSAIRAYELSQSIVGSYDIDDSGGGLPSITHTPPKTRELSLDEQAAHIKRLGLEGMVKPTQGYTQEAFDIVTSRKFEENAIKETRESAPMQYTPLGLAAGLGVALADPVNIASAFFPVVGEARAMQLLRGASGAWGAWGRAGVRAGIGAVEGAVGAAVVEPAIYAAKTFEQADYDMADSLMNIGFGAVFGAALQPAFGAVGEFMRARRGARNPWEVAPATEATEKLRSAFADEMYTALVKANPALDRSVADAGAALFDARARTWGYDMGRPAEEYYTRYKPDFADGAATSPVAAHFQPSPRDIDAAAASLREDVQLWNNRLDAFAAGKLIPSKQIVMLRQTPLILQMLGAQNLSVRTSYGVLQKVLRDKHKLPDALVRQVPEAMTDPVMVFKSDSESGSLVMMLDLKDAQGATVVVPVALQKKGRKGYLLHIVSSMYAKNDDVTGQPRNSWFIRQMEKGNLLYGNNSKSRAWAGSVGLQLPAGGTPLSEAYTKKIYTEADLVNLRREHPGLYQAELPQALDADAAVKLREEAAAWGNTVDAIAAGKKPSRSIPMLTQTPLILHLLGAEFRELHAAPHMFDGLFPEKTRNPRHNAHPNITPEILKQIPQALADPIMVFDSERGGGRLVFMLNVKDAGGATVVVPVELEGKTAGRHPQQINILTSAFAKEREGVADNAWFVRQAQKNLRYINEGKTKRWSSMSRVQFPFDGTANASGKRIATEADLVNLRRKHPGLYQEGNRKADALVEQKSGAAPRVGGDPGLPKLHEGDAPREYAALPDKNIRQQGTDGNGSVDEDGLSLFGSDSPRASVTFEEEGKAEEYYARYKPDFAEVTQESGETLQQAMYRSKAQNISDFIDESGHIPKNEKQSVYVFGDVRREDAGIPASSLELDSDTVRHIKNRHPDFSEWDNIVDVVNSGDVFEISPDTKTKYPGRAFALETENGVHVVLGYIKSGKHGDRFVIGTTFRDSKAAFEHWLKQNNAAAIYQSAGGSPAQPKPAKTGRVSDLNSGNMSVLEIDQSTSAVNGIESTPEETMQFFGLDTAEAAEAEMGAEPRILYQKGDEALQRDASAWRTEADAIAVSGKVPSSPVLMLRQTPLVMQMIGAKERPIYAAPHAFDGTHPNITPDMLKGLPEALADPIAIFQSKTHKDRLVFMLEMTDAKGATVVVPLHLDGTKDRTTIHIATTVYAKERKGSPDNAWFVKQAESALYINRQKEKRWLMSSGSNSLWDAANALSGKNIRTDEDLVKLKRQYPALYSNGSDSPRASVTFEEEGKAVIRFFSSVDPTSAPHELYHIFRRELAETAADASAPARVREDWRAIEEFVQSRPGEAWNVFQEERFAKAGEKFLMEGVAPAPALQRVFERLKQWFSEIYNQADAAGIPISNEMRKVFSHMMSMEDADTAFRYALGEMHSRNVAKEFAGSDESTARDGDTTNVNTVGAVVDDSAAAWQEHMNGVAASEPALAAAIVKEYEPALQQADAEIAKTATYRDVLREAALCETRR